MTSSLKWNPQVKLILADVDETIADVYLPTDKKTIELLERLIASGIKLFLISGGGLKSICDRVAFLIRPEFRKNIFISHCSGAEVWGFNKSGSLKDKPFYSLYKESVSKKQRKVWRKSVKEIVKKFGLVTYNTMPVKVFVKKTKGNPLSVMLDDRGPQITLEVVNGYDLSEKESKKLKIDIPLSHGSYDMRVPIVREADKIFEKNNLPINSRIEGVFAINFAIKGASKETSIKYIFDNPRILKQIGITKQNINNPEYLEIWGDKFSELRSKHDSLMCRSVNPNVRAIDFRQENPDEFPKGYNIVVWDGKLHLHKGLLEYLKLSWNG